MKAGAVTVLVVDDQDGIRQLLYEILISEGFKVKTASNGYKALELLETSPPVILIIDMKMPGMSGLEVLKKIKEEGYKCLPILMTAYGELEIVKDAAALGVSHFINKPFDIDQFRQLIFHVADEL